MPNRMILSIDVDNFPQSEIGIERILDLLEKKDIMATFFVAGKFAEEQHDVIAKIHSAGHEIGCHGYSHGVDVDENFIDLGYDEQKKRLELSSKILKSITGQDVKVFRAPYAKANHATLNVLEELGYECDSSVTSMRFDFGMGVGNNLRAFFAPTKPYHPSKSNLFVRGDASVLEIPISAFVVPLTMSALRTFGTKKVNRLFGLASRFFDPVVFYLHPWEVMEMNEIDLWEGLPKRHRINRGFEALKRLKEFIDHVSMKCKFTTFNNIIEVEPQNGQ